MPKATKLIKEVDYDADAGISDDEENIQRPQQPAPAKSPSVRRIPRTDQDRKLQTAVAPHQ